MEQDNKQEDCLKKPIKILAEMTRKDTQRSNNFTDIKLSPPKKVLSSYLLLKEL